MSFDLGNRVLGAAAVLLLLLIAASCAVFALKRARPGGDFSNLEQRVRSWWIMVLVFVMALALGPQVSLLFFALLSALAFREYMALVPRRGTDRHVLFWAYASIPFQYVWIGMGWYGMFIIWVPVYVYLFLPLRMVLIGETAGFLQAAGTVHWGLMKTVFAVGHVAYLLILPAAVNPAGGGAGLVLYLVFLTQFNDVCQYLWGRTLGRHKALPTVSPGKTVEGVIGGLATTLVLAWLLAPWLTPLDVRESLVAGVLIGLGGFVGDVVISAVKRDVGTKDSGTLLPGHGGLLDRLDSLTYTAPLFFHLVYYTHA